MLDIVTGLLDNRAAAMRWLIARVRNMTSAPARSLYRQTVDLASSDQQAVADLPGGGHLLECWARRRQNLKAYRARLLDTGIRPEELLPDLLHLHHVRAAGLDRTGERACLHLARAAALSQTARAKEP